MKRAKVLVEQYAAFEPLPGLKVDGELTLGENIGDLTGRRDRAPRVPGSMGTSITKAQLLATSSVLTSLDGQFVVRPRVQWWRASAGSSCARARINPAGLRPLPPGSRQRPPVAWR
jgi:hypothetical protein